MPTPISNFKVIVSPPTIVQQPELACRLVAISSQWSVIEDWMALLFAVALRTEPAWAAATLGRSYSLHTRLNMIETAIELSIGEAAAMEFKKTVRKSIKKASNKRNEVVHCSWICDAAFPNAIIRSAGISRADLKIDSYNKSDLQDIERVLENAYTTLRKFVEDIGNGHFGTTPSAKIWQYIQNNQDAPPPPPR